ncbi:hypothetical protein HDU97_000210 [Phlyctochytrium planicorne]|nr:hypothetical protein HDU97_000210 [Phlyctochytrium planicorne]
MVLEIITDDLVQRLRTFYYYIYHLPIPFILGLNIYIGMLLDEYQTNSSPTESILILQKARTFDQISQTITQCYLILLFGYIVIARHAFIRFLMEHTGLEGAAFSTSDIILPSTRSFGKESNGGSTRSLKKEVNSKSSANSMRKMEPTPQRSTEMLGDDELEEINVVSSHVTEGTSNLSLRVCIQIVHATPYTSVGTIAIEQIGCPANAHDAVTTTTTTITTTTSTDNFAIELFARVDIVTRPGSQNVRIEPTAAANPSIAALDTTAQKEPTVPERAHRARPGGANAGFAVSSTIFLRVVFRTSNMEKNSEVHISGDSLADSD